MRRPDEGTTPAAGAAAGAAAVADADAASATPGRRERNKRDKQGRILAAAEDLFAERGYALVTTQDIADRADVAAGTLFRYASSKPELLLMVFNNEWRRALTGTRHDPTKADASLAPTDAIMALLLPLLTSAARHPENTAYYQREILCGEPTGTYRAEALELVDGLEATIATVLSGYGTETPGESERLRRGVDPALAARSIFSLLHLALIRCGLGREPMESLPDSLRTEIDLVLHGIVEQVPAATAEA
ncbi:helix-turn-helix domain-containing protein [Cryobacterium sp. 10I1]|uniref:TetR/AcrR family transcriptional regulator n=1 Tax=unclassified Cryobacterium TaxID=2649013 RepID=UPI002AC9C983|nr:MULTISPECIES: helix-turn-helix domain-containing protein [unclassified Cryobacterium]MEB0201231.1 helix-turn-helix domain-containing protein [Cryobacterium sp. 5I3]MEB0287163.1 helix-turn-helix domain-containing protein [Cryobacterium sp. 10S3]MEB0305353.1 helix-turn-helix domain-containing protein [Cryobacterium sp. 10I1]WPX12298.1 helix-turn-helix domain-containing protein [Cryobacterium sp. 10S3]